MYVCTSLELLVLLGVVVVLIVIVVVGALCVAETKVGPLIKTATTQSSSLGLSSTLAFFTGRNVVLPPSGNIPFSSHASGRHGGDASIIIGPFASGSFASGTLAIFLS